MMTSLSVKTLFLRNAWRHQVQVDINLRSLGPVMKIKLPSQRNKKIHPFMQHILTLANRPKPIWYFPLAQQHEVWREARSSKEKNPKTDNVLSGPFFVLSTDYDGYAIGYTCSWLKEKIRVHYVFTWVLTRSKEKLQGELLKKVEDKLSKYTDLAEHRQSFVFKDFSDASCAYTHKLETDFFSTNFW